MVLNRQNVFAVKTDHSYDNGNESSTFPSIFQVFFNSSIFKVFFKSFSSLFQVLLKNNHELRSDLNI